MSKCWAYQMSCCSRPTEECGAFNGCVMIYKLSIKRQLLVGKTKGSEQASLFTHHYGQYGHHIIYRIHPDCRWKFGRVWFNSHTLDPMSNFKRWKASNTLNRNKHDKPYHWKPTSFIDQNVQRATDVKCMYLMTADRCVILIHQIDLGREDNLKDEHALFALQIR